MTSLHYEKVASQYDYFFEPIYQANLPIIINKLELKSDDLLVDVGSGTGHQAHMIWKQMGLTNPVTCVDPSPEMHQLACSLDGLTPVMKTAEEFFVQPKGKNNLETKVPFNKVLLCGTIHHYDKPKTCVDKIIEYLPKGGICLLLVRPTIGWPLPFSRLQLHHLSQTKCCVKDIIFPYVKDRNDVAVELTNEEFPYDVTKGKWYSMIRGRFMSNFNRYTDQEIQESIEELEKERFAGVKYDACITIRDQYNALKITKTT